MRQRFHRDDPDVERWVRSVHDTRSGEDLVGIARAEDDTLVSWHVTDQPSAVISFLRRRGRLVRAFGEKGKHAELGPGLYLGNPQFWTGRSMNKWAFLKRLSRPEQLRLLDALRTQVEKAHANGWLTTSEYERAVRTLERNATGSFDDDWLVALLANQPYNIAFWRDDFLRPLGIEPAAKPSVVEVRFKGRFAEIQGSYPPRAVLRTLRRMGLQGAFTRAAMTSNAELVLWDPRAVVSAREVSS